MSTINMQAAKKIMAELNQVMKANKQMLIDLDSVMGDGDLGLTMEKIFSEAHMQMQASEEPSLGKYFAKCGMVMAKAAPSTMGTLVASAFMKAGKNLGEKTDMDAEELKAFYAGLLQGVVERGKASVGEKTIVDVLHPVAEGLISLSFASPKEVAEKAYIISQAALEKTKDLVAQHGRAAYYQDKSKGHQDAGATVAMLIFKGFAQAL